MVAPRERGTAIRWSGGIWESSRCLAPSSFAFDGKYQPTDSEVFRQENLAKPYGVRPQQARRGWTEEGSTIDSTLSSFLYAVCHAGLLSIRFPPHRLRQSRPPTSETAIVSGNSQPKPDRTCCQTLSNRRARGATRPLSWRVSPDLLKLAEPVRKRRWSTQ